MRNIENYLDPEYKAVVLYLKKEEAAKLKKQSLQKNTRTNDGEVISLPSEELPNNFKRKMELSTPAEMADRFLGHLMVNGLLPPTLLAVLGMYDPALVDNIVDFFKKDVLGKHTLSELPGFNVGVSAGISIIELLVRLLGNKISGAVAEPNEEENTPIGYYARKAASVLPNFPKFNKEDLLVHTPFIQIAAFSRKQALLFVFVAYAMQTINGLMMENPDALKSETFAARLKTAYQNPLFALLGQIVGTWMIEKLSTKVVIPIVSGLWNKAVGCCSTNEFAIIVDQEQESALGA